MSNFSYPKPVVSQSGNYNIDPSLKVRQCCKCNAWLRYTQYVCPICGHTVQGCNGKCK